jgi:alpha-methylacyl-CoA racemase
VEVDGVIQPAPAPRFSRTEPRVTHSQPAPGADSESVLESAGFTVEEIAALEKEGVIPSL